MESDQHLEKAHGTDAQTPSTQAEGTPGAEEPTGNSQHKGLVGAIMRTLGQGQDSSDSQETKKSQKSSGSSGGVVDSSVIPESLMHPGSGEDSSTTVFPNVRHLSLLDTSALMAVPTSVTQAVEKSAGVPDSAVSAPDGAVSVSGSESGASNSGAGVPDGAVSALDSGVGASPSETTAIGSDGNDSAQDSQENSPQSGGVGSALRPQPGRSLPYRPILPTTPVPPTAQPDEKQLSTQAENHQPVNGAHLNLSDVTLKAGGSQSGAGVTVGAAAQISEPHSAHQQESADQRDRVYQSDRVYQPNLAPAVKQETQVPQASSHVPAQTSVQASAGQSASGSPSAKNPKAGDASMAATVAASIAKSQREALASYGVQRPVHQAGVQQSAQQPGQQAGVQQSAQQPGQQAGVQQSVQQPPKQAGQQPAYKPAQQTGVSQRPSPRSRAAAQTAEVPAAVSQAAAQSQPKRAEVYPAPAQLPGYEGQKGKPFERPDQPAAPASTPTPVSGLWITWFLAGLLVVAIFGVIALLIAWRGAVENGTPAPETVTQSVTIIKTPSSTVSRPSTATRAAAAAPADAAPAHNAVLASGADVDAASGTIVPGTLSAAASAALAPAAYAPAAPQESSVPPAGAAVPPESSAPGSNLDIQKAQSLMSSPDVSADQGDPFYQAAG